MSDAHGNDAGDGGRPRPRDTAGRAPRLPGEIEARHRELLSPDGLVRIARAAGVSPEYVRRALDDDAHVAERRRERRRRRRHGLQRQPGAPRHDPGPVVRRPRPLPMLTRVIGGVFGIGVVIQVISLVPEASVAVSTSLADGLQLRDAVQITLAVLAFAFFGGMGLLALRVALNRSP